MRLTKVKRDGNWLWPHEASGARVERVKARAPFSLAVRVVSLVPAATEMACALGLQDELVGVTFECSWPAEVRGKPVVVESTLPSGLGSAAIDEAVRGFARAGRSLYRVNTRLLRDLRPDVLLTQALCDVCAASRPDLREAMMALDHRPAVVTLSPTTLPEALNDIARVGEATGRAKEAEALMAKLWARVRAVEQAVQGAPRPRVVGLEWLAPPMCCGHWVPDMVARAGGREMLGEVGLHARYIPWGQVAAARPDVLVAMPCGFDAAGAAREAQAVLANPALRDTPAVQAGRVVAVDADAHFSRPGPRLVDGLEVLAALLHPDLVPAGFPWAFAELAPEA